MDKVPEAPWILSSRFGFALTGLVPLRRIRDQMPPDATPIAPIPGFGIQVLAAARYEAGSTLSYSELLVATLVRTGSGTGIVPLVLYVDDDTSRRGGREIWALPKELATFSWEERHEPRGGTSYELVVQRADQTLLSVWWMPRWFKSPFSLDLPVISTRDGVSARWAAQARGTVRSAACHVEAPPGSTLRKWLPRPAWAAHLGDLELTVPAPRWP